MFRAPPGAVDEPPAAELVALTPADDGAQAAALRKFNVANLQRGELGAAREEVIAQGEEGAVARPGECARLRGNHPEQEVLIYAARLPPLRTLAPPHAPQCEVEFLGVRHVGAAKQAVDPPERRELAPDGGVFQGELVGLDEFHQYFVVERECRHSFRATPVDKLRHVCVV